MKLLIVFALALSTASAFRMPNSKLGITNGKNATAGKFPYQVGLFMELEDNKGSWCGGSLLGKKWVLSAAHCVDVALSVTVYLGATKSTNPELEYTVSSSNIIVHPGWDGNFDDISLIKIPATSYTRLIKPVKLPAISSSYSSYTGKTGYASGWGRISDSATGVTDDLQWARMKIISNAECAKTFGPDITSSIICVATPGGVSICKGDSGGPLVLKPGNVQVGLSAFVYKYGCEKEYPAAFTRVTSYLDWIEEHTGISYTQNIS